MRKKVSCTHKNFETKTKSWINIKKVPRITKFHQKERLKP